MALRIDAVGTIINRLGEKSQLTVIASANNSNNQSFTDLDIDMEQSSFINQDARAREKRLGLASPEQIPTIDPDAGVTESAIAGINTSLDLNPFVNINGNGQYGYADQLVTTQPRKRPPTSYLKGIRTRRINPLTVASDTMPAQTFA